MFLRPEKCLWEEGKNAPGDYSLAKKMTLSQAITLASGLTPKAGPVAVNEEFRYAGQGEQKGSHHH